MPCHFEMWVLSIPKYEIVWPLYGRIIPEPQQLHTGWRVAEIEKLKQPIKGRILRARLSSDGKTIAAIISRLLEGKTLTQACSDLKVVLQKSPVDNLRLGLSTVPPEEYAVRAPLICLPRQPHSRGYSSFSDQVPTLVGSLACINKFEAEIPDLMTDEVRSTLLKHCLHALQRETKLAFLGWDSTRLGNIEWALLLASDVYELPFISVNFEAAEDTTKVENVCVEFGSGAVSAAVDVIVQCRTISSNNITGDTIETLHLQPNSSCTIRFSAGEALSNTLVRVWRQNDNEWHLWTEIECGPIRAIHTLLGLEGVRGTSTIQRLEPYAVYKKQPKVMERAQTAQSVTRRHYEMSLVGDAEMPSWLLPNQRFNQQVQGWLKPPTGAQFFPQGQKSEEGFGLLEFAEWFKSLLGGPNLERIVIADPYFDALGIDYIAGAEVAGLHCQVITTTELTTTDEKEEVGRNQDELPPRAKRLVTACAIQFIGHFSVVSSSRL